MVNDPSLDQWRIGKIFPHAVKHFIALQQQEEKPNLHIPRQLRFRQRPVEEKAQLERQWKRWGWNKWSQSSSSSSKPGGRHKNGKHDQNW